MRTIDLVAKWKHGWIPLNAEAEAILAAKSEHHLVPNQSHDEMLKMPLSQLKKHYSATIKAHGFQHPYTKKVGKAVGSHPESLAATKAKADAKKAPGGAPSAPATVPEPAAPAAPASPSVAKPDTVKAKLQADYPDAPVTEVHSAAGKHIGYAAVGAPDAVSSGKKHAIYNLKGESAGYVNSFTGAQHVLGEKTLGKPKPPAAKDPDDLGTFVEEAPEATPEATPEPPAPAPPKPAKIKPPKIEPDPEPPKHPGAGTPGWVPRSKQELDEAPVGTYLTGSYQGMVKQPNGNWNTVRKNDAGEWVQTAYGQDRPSNLAFSHASGYSMGWGHNGLNQGPSGGYTGPRYRIEQQPNGKWGVVDNYNGNVVDQKAGKPNASKKSNDLNWEAGTPTASQRKLKAVQQAKMEAQFASQIHPDQMNHPKVTPEMTPEQAAKLTFDGKLAGALPAQDVPGATLTPGLFDHWQGSSSAAKRNVASQIGDRMAEHDGYGDQQHLDQAWVAMGAAGVGWNEPPKGFNGDPNDAYSADPQFSSDGAYPRGTPEYQRIMREQMVGRMIQWWAASSNDDHVITLSLQEMAAERFGINDAAAWNNASASTKEAIKKLRDDPAFRKLAGSFLQAQYDTAQTELQRRGITHLTLRRGMKAGVSSSINVGDTGALKMRPMSSWSTNAGTAEGFSGGKYVLQTTVPREKVLGFAGYGFGCLGEYEVVVLGGNTTARLVKKGTSVA